jgi:non-heme chloroperoxidase
VAAGAGPYATYACIDTWPTDFRGDLPKIDIPVLALHGTADRVLPFEVTTARLSDERLVADLTGESPATAAAAARAVSV